MPTLESEMGISEAPTSNPKLLEWLEQVVRMCRPDKVQWCDGSRDEYQRLAQLLTETAVRPVKAPNI